MHNLLEQEETRVTVESQKLIIHENFEKSSITNDIGVIVLNKEVELNEYVNVATLPSHDDVTNKYEGKLIANWL